MRESDSFSVSRNTMETMRDAAWAVTALLDRLDAYAPEHLRVSSEDARVKARAISQQLDHLCSR